MFETTAIYHRLTPEVRVALQAEDERIIERAGGMLRSTQLVALVTAASRDVPEQLSRAAHRVADADQAGHRDSRMGAERERLGRLDLAR